MGKCKYPIFLTADERKTLEAMTTTGKAPAKAIRKANVLLASDQTMGLDWTIDDICSAYHVSRQGVIDIRKEYFFNNHKDIKTVVARKKRVKPPIEPKITGEVEARVMTIAQTNPPPGYARWTVRLIAAHTVEIKIDGCEDGISPASVSRILKKKNFSLTGK